MIKEYYRVLLLDSLLILPLHRCINWITINDGRGTDRVERLDFILFISYHQYQILNKIHTGQGECTTISLLNPIRVNKSIIPCAIPIDIPSERFP